MASWNDLGGIFNTLRELDVSAIEEESQRQLSIACVGDPRRCAELAALLQDGSAVRRFGADGPSPLTTLSPQQAAEPGALAGADLILVALDGRLPPQGREREALTRVFGMVAPLLVVVLYGGEADPAALPANMRSLTIADPDGPEAREALATALAERLPRDLALAAARRLPGLRPAVAAQLIQSTSTANASYALASSLPQQIPLLSLPFAAADIFVLTKNQALMVYRLALAHGAPADFQAHLREILPVIGGAYIWRQIARTLVGLIPGWGVVPKLTVAYAGTYTTGTVAASWYGSGELVQGARMRQIAQEAMARAKIVASDLAAVARERGGQVGQQAGDLLRRARRALPGGRPKE